MRQLHWADPWVLIFLPLIAGLLWSQLRASLRRRPAVGYSDLKLVKWHRAARPAWEGHIPQALTALAMVLLLVTLARPQLGLAVRKVSNQGIDIVLCLDTSGSMQAQDLQPDRIQAAVKVCQDFAAGRPNDRIGVVVYGAVAITQCPLTLDHSALDTYLKNIGVGATGTDGTAIGNGIATAVNRLKDTAGKSKVIILLTDGCNNAGEIDPLAAAKLAKAMNIKIYTIGVGTRGEAPITVKDPFGISHQVPIRADLDEEVLTKIAQETNGRYFRATDNESLGQIYAEIDRMEKTDKPKQEVVEYRELYWWFLVPALVIQVLGMVLESTVLQEVP